MKPIYIVMIFMLVLYSAVIISSYSEFGAPVEFGNLTNTTCWIGGDLGELRCLGQANFSSIITDEINISGDIDIGGTATIGELETENINATGNITFGGTLSNDYINITDNYIYGDLFFPGTLWFGNFFDGDCRDANEVVQYIDEWGTFYCADVSALVNETINVTEICLNSSCVGDWSDVSTPTGLDSAYDVGENVIDVDTDDVVWNLTSTQDFIVQDNGAPVFTVRDNGYIVLGQKEDILFPVDGNYHYFGGAGGSDLRLSFRGSYFSIYNRATLIADFRWDEITFKKKVWFDGDIVPSYDDDAYDIGSSSYEWRNLYVDGTAEIDDANIDYLDVGGGYGSIGLTIDGDGNISTDGNINAGTISGILSAENVSVNLPSNCSTNYAVTGWDGDLSTTWCTQFEEPGDYLETSWTNVTYDSELDNGSIVRSHNITWLDDWYSGTGYYTDTNFSEDYYAITSRYTTDNHSLETHAYINNCSAQDSCSLVTYDTELSTYLENGTDANFGNLDVTTEILAEKITHRAGDDDTYIDFSPDKIEVVVGNVEFLEFFEALGDVLRVNPTGSANLDFAVYDLYTDYLLYANAGTSKVGIGTNAPSTKLEVIGNITADNVWLPSYLFAHTNNTIEVATGGVWQNVTFDEEASDPKKRVTHTYSDGTNDTFTIVDDGDYLINYAISFQDDAASPNAHCVVRIIKNGVEIPGSLLEEDSHKQYHDFTVSNGPIAALSTGDEIKLQFTADDTSVSMQSHLTYGDHKDSATIRIHRVG